MTASDRGMAPGASVERPDRSREQLGEAGQASIGFGFTRFHNYSTRALLYAGRPNWDLLPTVTPR